MLAAMTSLASIAHPAAHVTQAFNGLFFATAATVIPVLFLAIAVQGHAYENLLRASADAYRREWQSAQYNPLNAIISPAPEAAAMLILVFGVAGEITAILTLSQEAASVWARYIVEFAVIFLTVVAAAGPALALIRASRSDADADSPGEPSTAEPPANEEDPEGRGDGPALPI
jgi:hypothetical protein